MKFGYILVVILVASTVTSFYLGFTPLAAGLILLMFSLITYGLYAKDKKAAQSGAWRVSERTLHIASLLGGWPGALIAQQRLRHKTRKASFRAVFWVTLLVNSAGLAWLHTPQGNAQLRNGLHRVENAAVSHIQQEAGLRAVLFLTKLRPQQHI
ncbi:DUF1294 domain-containing protein [Marinimicrobium sp. C2-29]|uniref:DUF1294 domain-containing protein n=1 Tax=Marinimicrobium sp. C2-29 TaxID=3139825 RepID=UPI0031397FA8